MFKNFWLLLTLLPDILQAVLRILDHLEDASIKNKKDKAKLIIGKGFKDENSDDLNKSLNL